VVSLAAGLAAAGVRPAFGTNEKITICHAAGQEGTTKFVTLELPPAAVFGPGGHFNENGTPAAGHEQDYMGPCRGDTTSTETTGTTETTETTTTETTTTETTTTTDTETEPPTTETTPSPPCPNGEPPIHGQDGNPGNDACDPCAPPVNVEKCPPPGDSTTIATETTPTETQPPLDTGPGPGPIYCPPGTHGTYPNCKGNEPPASPPAKPQTSSTSTKKKAKPKPPPTCPPGKPFAGKCGVQGSG
jgi:hypothetical protein